MTSLRVLIAAVLVVFWIAGCGPGPEGPDVLLEIRLKDLRFRHVVRDLTMVQTITVGGRSSRVVVMRKGERFRMEAMMPVAGTNRQALGVIIADGSDAWVLAPGAGRIKLKPEDALLYRTAHTFWWERYIRGVRTVERSVMDGRGCYLLTFMPQADLSYRRLWADRRTLARVRAEAAGPDGRPVVYRCSDFRVFAGEFEVPFRTEMHARGAVEAVFEVQSIQINTGLADALFSPEDAGVASGAATKPPRS